MKFLLNSTIDTLPTRVNLKMWGKVSSDKCRCGRKETLNHILNCCTRSLNEGRYTYRHDCILKYISGCLDPKYKSFVDIPGHQTPGGGTLPPNVAVSVLKPDVVIVDKSKKTVDIFELTVPAEHRLKISHDLKYQKYSHLVSDSHNLKVNVTPFEVGSHTGYINSDNKKYINALHKFCKKNIKLKLFMQNMSAISVMSSYYIFNCRNFENWEDMEPIQPPFKHQ